MSGALAAEVKRPGHEANHSPPSSTEVKNDGSWFELSNTSDAPFHRRVRVIYFYSWDNPANLRNGEVRNREKRRISVLGKSLALMELGCSLPCSQTFAPSDIPGLLNQFHTVTPFSVPPSINVLPSACTKTRDAGLLLKNLFFCIDQYKFVHLLLGTNYLQRHMLEAFSKSKVKNESRIAG